MPNNHLEQLRIMVLEGNPGPADFYPISLIQLSTLGVMHNMSPIAQTKVQPEFESVPAREIPIFRFYFDGLIAHFARQDSDDGWAESLGRLMVGAGGKVLVTTVAYEASFEHENLGYVMKEVDWD